MSRLLEDGEERNVCRAVFEKVGEEAGIGDVLEKEERSNAPPNTPIFRPEARVRLVAFPRIRDKSALPPTDTEACAEEGGCLILDQEFACKLWEEPGFDQIAGRAVLPHEENLDTSKSIEGT